MIDPSGAKAGKPEEVGCLDGVQILLELDWWQGETHLPIKDDAGGILVSGFGIKAQWAALWDGAARRRSLLILHALGWLVFF